MIFLEATRGLSPAYLDAGAGSLIVQSTIAGVLTAGYVVRTRWAMIRTFVATMIAERRR